MNQTQPKKPRVMILRKELKDLNYGIQFKGHDDEIHVSPAIYSLYKTDKEALMENLEIQNIKSESFWHKGKRVTRQIRS